jgi:hypothetical protein
MMTKATIQRDGVGAGEFPKKLVERDIVRMPSATDAEEFLPD